MGNRAPRICNFVFAFKIALNSSVLDTSLSLSMTARGYATLLLWIATKILMDLQSLQASLAMTKNAEFL
ncbi:hypothetical protein [Campylobacter troglodytis]|uniref:hypothetical protein n=1 Tax=Campylobacter troglodytis TaxID=654363 RepID=UPI001158A6DB|nr:hypothetical protein [Campylobacter troglodytis]TQR61181.1 hypothetical protein DMC01_02625 [Campylobacter troglodytis]